MGYKVVNEFGSASSQESKEEKHSLPEEELVKIYQAFSRTYADALQVYVNSEEKDMTKLALEVIDLCEFVTYLKMELQNNPNALREMGKILMDTFKGE